MEHIVTGCRDCPFEYDGIVCCHPYTEEDTIILKEGELSPDWCPLIKEPITIIKK